MSAETDLYALLTQDDAVASLAPGGIAADRIEQDAPRPFGVFSRRATECSEALDGVVYATKVTLELQLWADKRLEAEALATACQTAISAAGQAVTDRQSTFDAELDLEAAVLVVEWWE